MKNFTLFISLNARFLAFIFLNYYLNDTTVKPYIYTNSPKQISIDHFWINSFLLNYHNVITVINFNARNFLILMNFLILLSIILTYHTQIKKHMFLNKFFKFLILVSTGLSFSILTYFMLRHLDPNSVELAKFFNAFKVIDEGLLLNRKRYWADSYGLKMAELYLADQNFVPYERLVIYQQNLVQKFVIDQDKYFFLKSSTESLKESAGMLATQHYTEFLTMILKENAAKQSVILKSLTNFFYSKTGLIFVFLFVSTGSLMFMGVLPGKQLFLDLNNSIVTTVKSVIKTQQNIEFVNYRIDDGLGILTTHMKLSNATFDQQKEALKVLLEILRQINLQDPQLVARVKELTEIISQL